MCTKSQQHNFILQVLSKHVPENKISRENRTKMFTVQRIDGGIALLVARPRTSRRSPEEASDHAAASVVARCIGSHPASGIRCVPL